MQTKGLVWIKYSLMRLLKELWRNSILLFGRICAVCYDLCCVTTLHINYIICPWNCKMSKGRQRQLGLIRLDKECVMRASSPTVGPKLKLTKHSFWIVSRIISSFTISVKNNWITSSKICSGPKWLRAVRFSGKALLAHVFTSSKEEQSRSESTMWSRRSWGQTKVLVNLPYYMILKGHQLLWL